MKIPSISAPKPLALPSEPFRGIEQFRYIDGPIFFGRDEESMRLVRLVTIYRGALLYGTSGSGKSSLINARFLPDIIEEGFQPDRVRVQPRANEEFVIERISLAGGRLSPFLPSSFANDEESARVVLSAERFYGELTEAVAAGASPLLIFDQFEELVTLFNEATEASEAFSSLAEIQRLIVETLLRLLRDPILPVKLLFVFREDYLAEVHRLFAHFPDLADHYLRLTPPHQEVLEQIIRGPFEEHPGHYPREFPPALAERLGAAVRERSEFGVLNLSEVQIACLRLWQAEDPNDLFTRRGFAGLLEDSSVEALDLLSEDQRDAAVALLGCLVTGSGTRNLVSGEELIARVQRDEQCERHVVEGALDALGRKARLVRCEFRHNTPFYDIVSEFLIPWIKRQKAERALNQEREEAEKKLAAERIERERLLKEERDRAETMRLRAEKDWQAEKMSRLKMTRAVLGCLLLVALGMTVWSVYSASAARNSESAARTAADREILERGLSDKARESAKIEARKAREAEKAARQSAQVADSETKKATDALALAEEKKAETKAYADAAEARLNQVTAALEDIKRKAEALNDSVEAVNPGTVVNAVQRDAVLSFIMEIQQLAGSTASETATQARQFEEKRIEELPPPESSTLPVGALGWIYTGRVGPDRRWGDRVLDNQTGVDPLRRARERDILTARSFVNVRSAPIEYDAAAEKWSTQEIIGLLKPDESIEVVAVKEIAGPAKDPWKRIWVLGKRSVPPLAQASQPPTSVANCWVDVWDEKEFQNTAEKLRFTGPKSDSDLLNTRWPKGRDRVGNDIGSLETGAGAWFIGYGEKDFAKPLIWVEPGSKLPNLPSKIKSFRLFDQRPPDWEQRGPRTSPTPSQRKGASSPR